MEDKKYILESLFETLTRTRKWSDEIAEMLIDVTGDSGMALIKDVIAALEEIR